MSRDEFTDYWQARWMETPALRAEFKATSVEDIARQAFDAGRSLAAPQPLPDIAQAVADERERCAKVAEAEDVAPTDDAVGVQECIAASIRRSPADGLQGNGG